MLTHWYCIAAPATAVPEVVIALAQMKFGPLIRDAARHLGSPLAVSVLVGDSSYPPHRSIPYHAKVLGYIDVHDDGAAEFVAGGSPGERVEGETSPGELNRQLAAELHNVKAQLQELSERHAKHLSESKP